MKARDLAKAGIPQGEPSRLALCLASDLFASGMKKSEVVRALSPIAANPERYRDDRVFGRLAKAILDTRAVPDAIVPREPPAPYVRYGSAMEPEAIGQMENACRLPVSVKGALLPDAHVGYGLPIGGVLAVQNAVIPYAVGVDIACRMKLTVLDMPVKALMGERQRLMGAIERETSFGVGAEFRPRREHPVMEEDWGVTLTTQKLRDRAWKQLGTSGSGNHFVEFGELHVMEQVRGLAPGVYLALLSHSGSRGAGNTVAKYYSELAMRLRKGLPRELMHLSWLGLDTHEGREYWEAMQLMGRYASANHELIHRHVARALGARVLLDIENHHNFAWREDVDGRELIVHRKGATPAAEGVLGIIPGSMATPGFVVRGRGAKGSINSASHGAGRLMSRKQARQSFTWSQIRRLLADRGVTLISAGLDEAPMAYKDIGEVMSAQADLIDTLARFEPRIVKMSPEGERPED